MDRKRTEYFIHLCNYLKKKGFEHAQYFKK